MRRKGKKGTTTKPPETNTKNRDIGNYPQYSCVLPIHNFQVSSQQITPPTHPFVVSTMVSLLALRLSQFQYPFVWVRELKKPYHSVRVLGRFGFN